MKPKEYSAVLSVRFSDLDMYGHVNVSRYLDFVVTSRWQFMQRSLAVSAEDFLKKGVGFYVTSARMSFLRGIEGLQDVQVVSSLKEIKGRVMVIEFQLRSVDGAVIYCQGEFEQKAISLATGKSMDVPEWGLPLLYDDVVSTS